MRSAFYTGRVTHRRTRPVAHALRYRVFMLLLDLDEAPALERRLRLFGRRRLLAFREADHGDGAAGGLRGWVERHLAAAGLAAGGAIRVLCMPRVLGHAFNPLTVYFCHAPGGGLQALIYEVNNTFGQRHAYLLPAGGAAGAGAGVIAQECGKDFHVSPFMDMDLRYRFRVTPPGESVGIGIQVVDDAGLLLAASFHGARLALTDRAILGQVLRMPVQGAKILLGIHWEALKLWTKGVRLRPSPAMPASCMSLPVPAPPVLAPPALAPPALAPPVLPAPVLSLPVLSQPVMPVPEPSVMR
jgi:DUF1365 family protein